MGLFFGEIIKMAEIIPQHFAQRTLETSRLPRAPLGIADVGAEVESLGLIGLGRALSGISSDALRNINIVRSEAQELEGTSQWERAHTEFFTNLSQDQDFENYGEKYKAFAKSLRRQVLKKGLTRTARSNLEAYVETQQVAQEKKVAGLFIDKQRDFGRVSAFQSVTNFERAEDPEGAVSAINHAQSAGFMSAEEAYLRKQNVQKNIEVFQIEKAFHINPSATEEMIEAAEFLDPQEKNQLRSRSRAFNAARLRQEAAALEEAQKQTGRKALVGLWEGTFKDVDDVTELLKRNLITETKAKSLRKAMLNPEPPKTDLRVYAKTLEVINDIGRGAIDIDDAMEFMYANLDNLDPTTGKSLVDKVFGEHNKNDSEMLREGRSLMEELIREKDPFSGRFSDNADQILGTAEAIIMLDDAIEKAAAEGKPLKRSELLIEAVEIGRELKRRLDEEEKQKIEHGFRFGEQPPPPEEIPKKKGLFSDFFSPRPSPSQTLSILGLKLGAERLFGGKGPIFVEPVDPNISVAEKLDLLKTYSDTVQKNKIDTQLDKGKSPESIYNELTTKKTKGVNLTEFKRDYPYLFPKTLTEDEVRALLREAGGDVKKARKLAEERSSKIPK
jgi:hypothetical protein